MQRIMRKGARKASQKIVGGREGASSIHLLAARPRRRNGEDETPVCEICGMDVQDVNVCKECDSKFCSECGDTKRMLCYDCLGWEDNEIDEDLKEEEWESDDLN